MPMYVINNNFTHGEYDPALMAQVEWDKYKKGARKMRNLIGLWTGAARIAPGTSYVDMVVDRTNNNKPFTSAQYLNAIDFQYGLGDDTDAIYTMVFRPDTTYLSAVDIYYQNALVYVVPLGLYTAEQIPQLHFAIGQDRILILHDKVQTRQLIRGGAHNAWTLTAFTPSLYPAYDFSIRGGTSYRVPGFTFEPGAVTGTTTLTASSAIFTPNHIGGLYIGGGGIARIKGLSSTTVIDIQVIDDFTAVRKIEGKLSSLSEVMWSSERGWPSRGVFFLNRLMLGNSTQLPNMIAISTAAVFDDFDDSATDDAAGFSASFNGRGNQSIQSIVADDSILFLTSNKIFAQNPLVDAPLSVGSFYFAPQTQNPASDIQAVTIDNQTLHVSGNYSQVMQVMYSTADAKYKAYPVGLLSAHLFKTINSNASWEPKNIQAKLYLATQTDGTMLMFNTLSQQEIACWSLRTTCGKFKRVVGEGVQAHAIVEREISVGVNLHDNFIDAAVLTNNTFSSFDDVSANVSGVNVAPTYFSEDEFYVALGNEVPFTSIHFSMLHGASESINPTFEYLDDQGFWDSFVPADSTNGFTESNVITWTYKDVASWSPATIGDGKERKLFWLRIRRNAPSILPPRIRLVTINTTSRIYLEKFDFDKYMDSSLLLASDASGLVTGAQTLAGQQVYTRYTNATFGPYFVEADGTFNIGAQVSGMQVGIQYKPLLVPMPILTPTQTGDNTYSPKYIQDLTIDYVSSLYLQIGTPGYTYDVPTIPLGNFTLDIGMTPQTGTFKIQPRGDWEPRQETIVTQRMPGPMTVISIGYTVEVT